MSKADKVKGNADDIVDLEGTFRVVKNNHVSGAPRDVPLTVRFATQHGAICYCTDGRNSYVVAVQDLEPLDDTARAALVELALGPTDWRGK